MTSEVDKKLRPLVPLPYVDAHTEILRSSALRVHPTRRTIQSAVVAFGQGWPPVSSSIDRLETWIVPVALRTLLVKTDSIPHRVVP